jgi:hypothetical protein
MGVLFFWAQTEVIALMDMYLNLNRQGLRCWLEYIKSKNQAKS